MQLIAIKKINPLTALIYLFSYYKYFILKYHFIVNTSIS